MELLSNIILSYLPEPHASLLAGITYGTKLSISTKFYQELITVGIIHIAVLSGMNISIVSAMIISPLVSIIGRKYAYICTIVCIFIYAILSGGQAPAMRAAIMSSLSYIGILFGRKQISLYTFFITILIMLACNFAWITSLSFQLTCTATLGIILFGRMQIDETVQNSSRVQTLREYMNEELRITAAAQVFTLPLIFWYFRRISLIAPVVNLLVGWTIAPIMLLGMCASFGGLISWYIGFPFAFVAYGLVHIIYLVTEYASKIPFASVQF